MFNTKLLTYDVTIKESTKEKIKHLDYKDKETLGVVVTNLLSGVRRHTPIVYSRRTGEKIVNVKRKINVRKVIKAVDFLTEQGYVENNIGTPSSSPDFRTVSTISPTEKFMNQFLTLDELKEIEQDYLDAIQSVILRDADKIAMEYISTDEIEKMKQTVQNLNKLNERATILMKDGTRLSNIYSRIFNESFEYGGRFYRADILQLHSKDGQQRLDITIDGESVVEVDFSNLHFRIAAVLEGMDMEDVPMDMYADVLDDPSNKVDRQIVKLAVNIMFNCRTYDSAKRAIQGEINSLSPEKKQIYTLGNARSVMAIIDQSYQEFVHLFCSEESFGRVLQNLDSHLASDILEEFIIREIPILCVHDSFVTARKNVDFLCMQMAEKFRKRFKIDCPVPLQVSWRHEDGSAVTKKVAL